MKFDKLKNMEILEAKQDESLQKMSPAKLKKMLEELEDYCIMSPRPRGAGPVN